MKNKLLLNELLILYEKLILVIFLKNYLNFIFMDKCNIIIWIVCIEDVCLYKYNN